MAKEHKHKSSERRLYFILGILIIIMIYYMCRLIYVQAIMGPQYREEAMNQWTKEVELPAERGNIYDRNGKMLAVNVTSFSVWAEVSRIKDPEDASIRLSEILHMPAEEIFKIITENEGVRKLKQSVTREEAQVIEAMKISGIRVEDGAKRSYPLGSFASHIIGFTNVDNEGLYGVEGFYDEHLAGIKGMRIAMTDAANRPLPDDVAQVDEPVDGYNIVLSVDETIQKYAEEAAEKAYVDNGAKTVSIIVMDPHTGKVLAMANKPDYDPNEPRKAPSDEVDRAWSLLSQEEKQNKWYAMWRNYAINDIYEPGSTYKIITAAAVLEAGKASLSTHYFCDGWVHDVPGARLKCSKWYDPHGDQTFEEAFANSCNPAFVEMARQIGKEGMLEYTKKFGFGDITGIDMKGEQKGIIPASADTMREVNLATLSYGHGIAVTPIQMVNSIAAVANGGNLMVPQVVERIVDNEGNVIKEIQPEVKNPVISESTANKMLDMLEMAVVDGTGKKAYVPGYRVGGKTGTALKIIDGRYAPGKYISSFGGVAPVDDPKVAVLVIVDEPSGVYYGGTVAGPGASYVIENTLEYMEVPRKYTDKELENLGTEIVVPDLVGLRIGEAGQILKDLGLRYTTQYDIFTEDALVINHYPKSNKIVTKNSIVDLYLDSGEKDIFHNEETYGITNAPAGEGLVDVKE